jgi:DNA-dependent RNA polymerase
MDFSQEDAVEYNLNSTSQQVSGQIIVNSVRTDPLYLEQLKLEETVRSKAQAKFKEDQQRLSSGGQMMATSAGQLFKNLYLEQVVKKMKYRYKHLKGASDDPKKEHLKDDSLLSLIDRAITSADFAVLAFIGLSEVVNSLDFGSEDGKSLVALRRRIGDFVEESVFHGYVQSIDPDLLPFLKRLKRNDQASGRPKKIKISVFVEEWFHLEWEGWNVNDKRDIAQWIIECVADAPIHDNLPNGEAENDPRRIFYIDTLYDIRTKKTTECIGLTGAGRQRVESIIDFAATARSRCIPMLCPPNDWDEAGVGGGYVTTQPGDKDRLIHNNEGSAVSPAALKTINHLQQVPWELNPFIHKQLVDANKRGLTLGSFKPFDKKRYLEINPLILFQSFTKEAWEEARKEADEGDDSRLRRMNSEYHQKCVYEREVKEYEQQAVLCKRVLAEASNWIDKTFYIPWFFDRRFRAYSSVDTLNPQGCDFQKALLQFSTGIPVSNDSYEELLVSLATTYGNGLDKKSYHDRIEGAKKLVHRFPAIVKSPLTKASRAFWLAADEPLQFLALMEEYYAIYQEPDKNKRRYEHKVSSGRDATCSGIQIAGALLRDAKTCHLVNVTPSDTVQDAYGAIAQEARNLLKNEDWVKRQIEARAERQDKIERKIQSQQAERKEANLQPLKVEIRPYKDTVDIPIAAVDRSVAKMVVMLTPYGGSFGTMLGHVRSKMEEKGYALHSDDVVTLTHALVEGMANALPGFSGLNKWFKQVAGKVIHNHSKASGGDQAVIGVNDAPIIDWVSPSGIMCRQLYVEEEVQEIKSYTHGELKRKTRYLECRQHGDGKRDKKTNERKERLLSNKMRSALAANVVHSLDASILHLALQDFDSHSFTANHDCVYAPSGGLKRLTDAVKMAFREVVSGDFLMDFLSYNDLEDDDELVSMLKVMTETDEETVATILNGIPKSNYLFC